MKNGTIGKRIVRRAAEKRTNRLMGKLLNKPRSVRSIAKVMDA
ncbi:hypothetical protein [Metabacillus fastidiosus]